MRKPGQKSVKRFDPDKISTKIHRTVTRDFLEDSTSYILDEDARCMFKERQVSELLKKYTNPARSDDRLVSLTLDKFLGVNEHMAAFQEVPGGTPSVTHPRQTKDERERLLLRARALVHFVLTPLEPDEFFESCQHGPGTTVGVSFADTSIEEKFTYPISCTQSVKPLLQQYFEWNFQLHSAVIEKNRAYIGDSTEVVEGSRATTVPKSDSIHRMIAVEPTANMFFQQGLMECMFRRMRGAGLDVTSLPFQHQSRARVASISGREATIDFSSASDCVSTGLLRWLMPPRWFRLFDMTRCKSMKVGDKWVKLNMSSTMGNAVTFPLETLVFWSLGNALLLGRKATHSLYPEWEELKSVSVFGDDCIVPDDLYGEFVLLCESVGFLVNSEKSFHGASKFRESCGGDYLAGVALRPYNIRFPTSTKQSALEPWLYTVANGLIKRYFSYFGPRNYVYAKHFFRYLTSLFNENRLRIKVVPDDFPDDSGLKISSDLERWQRNYKFQLSPLEKDGHGTYTFLYTRYRYRKTRPTEDALRLCMWLTKPTYSRRSGIIHERPVRVRGGYVVARGRSPCMAIETGIFRRSDLTG